MSKVSSPAYRRSSDMPSSTRPPSVRPSSSTRPPSYAISSSRETPLSRPSYDIPINRSSKADAFKSATQRRGSVSTGTPREPSKAALSLTPSCPHGDQRADSENAQLKLCESCEIEKSPIWNCSYCDMNFCDECWGKQGPHKAGRTGPDGLPHEKADPDIVKRLKDILTPPQDHTEQQNLHVDDEDTTWFGLARDYHNRPSFQDYGRYSAIMADSNSGEFKARYPQLVSFIGQTGAGKSTLIKMLIDQQQRKFRSSDWALPSPVAGSLANGSVPTSGDVHLYSDPGTYNSEYPMLYADCEGLEGGENTPMATQYRNNALTQSREKGKDSYPTKDRAKRHKSSKGLHCTRRDIKWANSPDTLKRQYAVEELYPRLLYTFSDVIVFVLRNPKTFESTVLSLLIDWASSSLEKSLNQPTLPHAIIALNATDTKVNQQEWDPEYATNLLLSSVAGAIHRDPKYCTLKAEWQERGKEINTMKDLLECYYSSITVVRIPGDGRYMMIDEQVKKLHNMIGTLSAESFNDKRRSRMLSNSDNLDVYLQCAFDHFAQDLHTPFNFMDVSFKINPIPLDFGGHILKLAVALKARFEGPKRLFKELSSMVSSCILLDIVRQNLKGPAEQLLEKQYLYHCDSALEDFCAIYWPCTFRNKRGEQCVNIKERHTKGHQNVRGNIIGTGDYEATFTFDDFADDWLQYLRNSVLDHEKGLNTEIMTSQAAEISIITKIHQVNLNTFYHRVGGAHKFISHLTCFCCLRELAEHPLPCGHVLCTPCIKSYGKLHGASSGSYTVASCPLHDYDTVFSVPSEVFFKPPLAGVRVLCLDGGGVRGIVILEVLRQVQNELGGCIPVQDFFDLIVGTSTGGILALGLGIKNWSVDHCIKIFLRMVEKAFTRKVAVGMIFGKTKYKTKPLEEALQESFQDDPIFGGVSETSGGCVRKVAVTAATATAEQAVIFTNYNRVDDEHIGYQLMRPDDPNDGLLIREAARATSAAPTFFKPFKNPRTMEGFLDGALFHNNPVRIANYESKLLWPDAEDRHPDILLSIGTGHNGAETDGFISATQFDRPGEQLRRVFNQVRPSIEKRPIPGFAAFNDLENLITIFKKRAESVLDAELTWREFRKDVVGTSSLAAAERYLRINPKTKNRTPKMDDKSQVQTLHDDVKSGLKSHGMRTKIKNVAHRLVASSFYFEKSGPSREAGENVTVQGVIQCRFGAGSDNLRNLGEYIRKHQRPRFQPFFHIQEVGHDDSAQDVDITGSIIREMTDRALFHMESIVIPMTSESSLLSINLHLIEDPVKSQMRQGFPISGFPRTLAIGEPLKRTASTSSPTPERPKMALKRQSLREKRNARTRGSLDRPSSDSEISLMMASKNETSPNIGLGLPFPESPDDVKDWATRRSEASRRPPKPVLQEEHYIPQPMATTGLYELDVGTPESVDPDEEALAYALELSLTARYGILGMDMQSVNNEVVVPGIERSDYDAFPPPIRTATGTDENELAKVLALSMHDH